MSLVESTLQQFFQHQSGTLVIAYSGGVDSQVLLHALCKLREQQQLRQDLVACHVNHGLSANAAAWQAFAEQQCQLRNIPLQTLTVSVVAKARHSLEALARDARYQALRETMPAAATLVTGHHANDQAETLLLALKRGAGLKGLSAMPARAPWHEYQLARPLLLLSRDDILCYARAEGLQWLDDESNLDTRFDRNFLRHDIMPRLLARWPAFLQTTQRSIEHCQQAQTLLDDIAVQDLHQCQLDQTSLALETLRNLTPARRDNVLRYFINAHLGQMPSSQQLKQLVQQLDADTDKAPALKLGRCWLRRFQQTLVLTEDFADIESWQDTISVAALHRGEIRIELPDRLGQLLFSLIDEQPMPAKQQDKMCFAIGSSTRQLLLGFQHDNPVCLPDYRQHSRALKKVLQELNIAPWQRKRIPLLYEQETGGRQLVAAVGHFVCQPYLASGRGINVLVQWLKS